ncbi:MAG: DUF763 domain-containing protein [Candidatus Methanoperedens sp.]|nr:DUF763 domain-containing protein [Candidatus Methanoperedens sp.]
MRTGTVNLPLHTGKAPRWLFERMVKLAGGITETIIYEYGRDEFLRRISDPFWFQAFSCVLGFDWHSSGTTTTTCGALKVALSPQVHGIAVAGGKGATSRKAPEEIERIGEGFSLSSDKIERLKYSSRMAAKVDSSCIQDGYELYHHCFFFTEDGEWAVVQQGMNSEYARRYHWLSADNFIEPRNGICCDRTEANVLDMTAQESEAARSVSLDLVNDDPVHLKKYFKPPNQRMLFDFESGFGLPRHHPVLDIDISERGMEVLKRAYELSPKNYEELISLSGMGQKTIMALALISDLVYGSAPSWRDPVKYSFTHGGKDGFPYPVDRGVYDGSIQILRESLENARLDRKERYSAIKRLAEFTSVQPGFDM